MNAAPAKFEEKFKLSSVKRGESVRLECDAKGDEPLTVSWIKDGLKVSRNERIDITESLTNDGVKSELSIRSAIQEDTGMFVCIAENSFGRDERTNKLFVLEVPASPSALQVKKVWSRSASISWLTSSSSNIPISGFVIQYWKESDSGVNHVLKEIPVSASQTELHLDKLLPGTSYEVAVLSVNDVGRSQSSSSLKFQTGEEEPSASPVDVSAEAKGTSTIRVTWKSPPKHEWNGRLEGFYVGFKQTREPLSVYTYRTVQFGSFNVSFEHFIPGLHKKTEYTIIVKAFNSAGSGPPSHEVHVKTYGGDFVESPKVHPMAIMTDSISLHCQLPKNHNNEISGFIVHFRPDSSSVYKEFSLPVTQANDAGFVAKDLIPNTLYHFYVTASSTSGTEGDPSPLISLRTRSNIVATVSPNYSDLLNSDLNLSIPVIAVSVVIVTIVFSYAYVKKAKLSAEIPPPVADYYATLRAGGLVDPSQVFVGTTRRYVDLDAGQGNLMQGNQARFQMKAFPSVTPNHRPLPPNPDRKSVFNFYDSSN